MDKLSVKYLLTAVHWFLYFSIFFVPLPRAYICNKKLWLSEST
jgi:hypothetical protein